MPVTMEEIPIHHIHPEDARACSVIDNMDKAVAWTYGTGQHRKAIRQITKIAHQPVGERTVKAKGLVHRGVHLAPIGTDGIRAIDILDHRHSRTWPFGHMAVIAKAAFANDLCRVRGWRDRRDPRRAGIADHRPMRRGRGQHRTTGEPVEPALSFGGLDGVADSRGIDRPKQG